MICQLLTYWFIKLYIKICCSAKAKNLFVQILHLPLQSYELLEPCAYIAQNNSEVKLSSKLHIIILN